MLIRFVDKEFISIISMGIIYSLFKTNKLNVLIFILFQLTDK
jgi:hypothetical protein